jgi:hypothetical protein
MDSPAVCGCGVMVHLYSTGKGLSRLGGPC